MGGAFAVEYRLAARAGCAKVLKDVFTAILGICNLRHPLIIMLTVSPCYNVVDLPPEVLILFQGSKGRGRAGLTHKRDGRPRPWHRQSTIHDWPTRTRRQTTPPCRHL